MQTESNSPLKKIITIAIVVVVVAATIYFFFFRSATPVITLDEFGNPVQAKVVGQDLIDLQEKLENVTLEEVIFSDPAFIALTDFSITLPSLPQGRANPFDLFPGQVVSSLTTPKVK